jgi:hypothetical protein
MADWTSIPDATFDPNRPVLGSTHLAIVKNFEALAEGASGAPRVLTAAINDAAVTTAKIANANVTTAKIANANVTTEKLSVATRSFSGSISGIGSVSISLADEFSFSPRITSGGGSISGRFIGNNNFNLRNSADSIVSYAVTWRYLSA